jgi:glycosyltransferase 2 family protein
MLNDPGLGTPATDFIKRHSRALFASLALVVGFVWVLRAGALPLLPPAGSLDRCDWGLVGLSVLGLLLSMLTRLGRSYFLLVPIAQMSFRRVFTTLCISLGLITFLPFRLGEVARPALLREKGKLSGWAVTATVGAERVIDGVVFGLMLLIGLAFAEPHEPLPDHIGNLPVAAALVPRAAKLATAGFGVLLVTMALFFFWRSQARRATEAVLGIFSKRFAGRVADAVERVSEGLRFLPNLRYTGAFLAVTAFCLVCHILALQVLARAVGLPDLTFAQATVVLGVLALGFAVPNAPGFFGSIQLALYAGLAVYVEPAKVVREGAAFVFVFYVIYLSLVILVTTGGLVFEYLFSHAATPAGAAPSSRQTTP